MKIAVLGTGNVGGTLGRRWAKAGHEVCFGSRYPDSEKVRGLLAAAPGTTAAPLAAAVANGDLILLAVPWATAQETIASLGDISGKILIDCINPLNATFNGLTHGHTTSAAEMISSWAPTAKVVKAFNTVGAKVMADPQFGSHLATLFYCGDDKEAKVAVHQLAIDIGFDAVDAGPLMNARELEPLAMLYIYLAVRGGWGSNTAFKIMRR